MNIWQRFLSTTLLLTGLILMAACAGTGRKPAGVMDNPVHHYQVGMDFIEKGKLEHALREFELALQLDKNYGPALAGKGLVIVYQGSDDGLRLILKGERKARTSEEKVWAIVAEIRAYIQMARQNMISENQLILKSKEAFKRGKVIDSSSPELYFYMGEAYLQALDFQRAEQMYARVKNLKNGFEQKADQRWELVQKANRAAPETRLGKKIVLLDKISRADMAGLLIEELNVERFYTRTQEPEQAGFEPPEGLKMDGEDLYKQIKVKDIDDHPLKNDILKVIDLGVKGLQPYPDHTFRPQAPMTKVEVALLYEDIIVRATGNENLASEYIGQESHIPDVPGSHYAFNAIMLCTTRGLLETDLRTGAFYPEKTISGVDALLSIKKLKEMLRLF